MYCRNCGKELQEGSKFCPYCGTAVEVEAEYHYSVPVSKKVSFKESIIALFNRFFVFEGTSSQREFNFGLLFLIIITIALTTLVVFPEITEFTEMIISYNGNIDMDAFMYYLDSLVSKDIFHFYNLLNIGIAIVFSLFLVAPIYRRMIDTGKTKVFSIIAAILFVVSQMLCCGILYCLLPDGIYNSIVIILDLLSIANLAIILMCVFGKTRNV